MAEVQKQGNTQELETTVTNFNKEVHSLQKRTDISHGGIDTTLEKHKTFIESVSNNALDNKYDDNVRGVQSHESPAVTPVTPEATPSVHPADSQTVPKTEIHTPQEYNIPTVRDEDN